jgi:lipoprotein-anchoring transpeptidase ErfK/SrfK
MIRLDEQFRKMAALAGVLMVAAAEAMAQEQAKTPRRIVVSIPDRKLALIEDDRVVKIYSTAVGAPKSPSPDGEFKIVQRIPDPTWYTKGKIVPPGKANPLGTRWIGLSAKSYGIHGTNRPSSIGRNASHGCIRMRNHDVEELFGLVEVGDTVELHRERTPELEQIFGTVTVADSTAPAASRSTTD